MQTVKPRTDDARERLRSAKAYIFDMDGVLYRGLRGLPGGPELLQALDTAGIPTMLATNNSMATPQSYTAKLARMGMTVEPERILTSGTATADYLTDELEAGSGLYVVGMPELSEQLFSRTTFRPVDPQQEVPRAVVVGLDLTFTYEKMKLAMAAIMAGAEFVATNSDATLPAEHGFDPGAGTMLAGIELATGVQPTVIGKPSPRTLLQAAKQLGADPATTVMVGDRLDTDILAGERAGMLTVLVLTGVSSKADIDDSGVVPDVILDDLVALHAELKESRTGNRS